MTLTDAARQRHPRRNGMAVLRMFLAMVVAVTLPGCVQPTRSVVLGDDTAGALPFARRFDRVERLVRTRYYARDLHGVNWTALCERYRPRAARAEDDAAWYATVNEMLRELRDVHTRAHGPQPHRRKQVREEGGAESASLEPRCARVLPDGVVYLRFDHFDRATVRWLTREVAAHAQAPGMILDLRDNRGGLVVSAQQAVGLFFAERVPMGWVITRNGRRTIERSRPAGRTGFRGPLTLLVGPGSHSSAEVFAYVMQHHARAVVIGQPTAGQVLGARPYRLPDGGQLYISVSDFRRFDDGRLEGAGIEPDVLVESSWRAVDEPAGHSSDPAIATAVENLQSRAAAQAAAESRELKPTG